MAPKKKGKGKKGTPKKTTKSQYFEKIKELNGILAEERTQAKLIEDEFLATEKKYETLQEDMSDIVEYLEHEVKVSFWPKPSFKRLTGISNFIF